MGLYHCSRKLHAQGRRSWRRFRVGRTFVWPGEPASCMRACIRFMSFLIVSKDVLFFSAKYGNHDPDEGFSHLLPGNAILSIPSCTQLFYISFRRKQSSVSITKRLMSTAQTDNLLTRYPCRTYLSKCRWLVRLRGAALLLPSPFKRRYHRVRAR